MLIMDIVKYRVSDIKVATTSYAKITRYRINDMKDFEMSCLQPKILGYHVNDIKVRSTCSKTLA